jgi:cyclic pyranopterin phosphate synthase
MGVDSAESQVLLDTLGRPIRDLRLSVTDRCNFRCPYCMPAEEFGPDHRFLLSPLSFEQIATAVEAFVHLGARRVKITGGEPLLRPRLSALIELLGKIDGLADMALVTNGARLASCADSLRRAGLRRITVSLDSLDPERYRRMTGGRGDLEAVLEGLAAARGAGFAPIKLNAVIIRDVNREDVLPLCEYGRRHGHPVRFIEYMDVGHGGDWASSRVVASRELATAIDRVHPLRPVEAAFHGEVASRYAYRDGLGEVGFISSVSAPFCRDCTRARLTADGRLYTCLFASRGADLRGALESAEPREELVRIVRGLWGARRDRYAEELAEGRAADPQRVPMHYVGG